MSLPSGIVNFGGWEEGDTSHTVSAVGNYVVQSNTVRSGVYALEVNPIGTGIGYHIFGLINQNGAQGNSQTSDNYLRFFFRYHLKPSGQNEEIFTIGRTVSRSTGTKFAIRINSDGTLSAYDSNAAHLMTGTTVLNSGIWYQINAKAFTGTSAPWEVKINENSEISGTGNLSTALAIQAVFGKFINRNNNDVVFYYDDWMWSSSVYPGEGRCTLLRPSGNGNYQTWSTSDFGMGDHYPYVDDIPHNSNTDYLQTPLFTTSETELLQSGSGQGINGTVNCVKGFSTLQRVTSNGSVNFLLRSSGYDSRTTDFTTLAAYVPSSKLFQLNPATSGNWTLEDLNNIETGCTNKDTTNASKMTLTGAMIDWSTPINLGSIKYGNCDASLLINSFQGLNKICKINQNSNLFISSSLIGKIVCGSYINNNTTITSNQTPQQISKSNCDNNINIINTNAAKLIVNISKSHDMILAGNYNFAVLKYISAPIGLNISHLSQGYKLIKCESINNIIINNSTIGRGIFKPQNSGTLTISTVESAQSIKKGNSSGNLIITSTESANKIVRGSSSNNLLINSQTVPLRIRYPQLNAIVELDQVWSNIIRRKFAGIAGNSTIISYLNFKKIVKGNLVSIPISITITIDANEIVQDVSVQYIFDVIMGQNAIFDVKMNESNILNTMTNPDILLNIITNTTNLFATNTNLNQNFDVEI